MDPVDALDPFRHRICAKPWTMSSLTAGCVCVQVRLHFCQREQRPAAAAAVAIKREAEEPPPANCCDGIRLRGGKVVAVATAVAEAVGECVCEVTVAVKAAVAEKVAVAENVAVAEKAAGVRDGLCGGLRDQQHHRQGLGSTRGQQQAVVRADLGEGAGAVPAAQGQGQLRAQGG